MVRRMGGGTYDFRVIDANVSTVEDVIRSTNNIDPLHEAF